MTLSEMTKQAREDHLPCELREHYPKCYGGKAFHHRKLRSAGGTDERENLIWVCESHHRHVHDHPALSYENGWLRHSWS